jgi:hypothetical protein
VFNRTGVVVRLDDVSGGQPRRTGECWLIR